MDKGRGEVLIVRTYWGVSPPRNSAHNRRPNWPQLQHREIQHWLTLSAVALTSPAHTNLSHRWDGHKHSRTANSVAQPTDPFQRGWERRLALTAREGFVGAVRAIGSSITVPVSRDAAAAGAAELTLGACGRSYTEDDTQHETAVGRWVCVLTGWQGGGIKSLFRPLSPNIFLIMFCLKQSSNSINNVKIHHIIVISLKQQLNSPQCVGLSSLISPQSLSPSHRYDRGMQMLVDWHLVCSGWQVLSATATFVIISNGHFDYRWLR